MLADMLENSVVTLKEFSDDQERDDHGRWTAGTMSYSEKLKHVSHMSNAQLKKEYDKASKASSINTDKFIAAGRGNERPSDYLHKDDPLSREAKELTDKHSAMRHEAEARGGPGMHVSHLGSGGARVKR